MGAERCHNMCADTEGRGEFLFLDATLDVENDQERVVRIACRRRGNEEMRLRSARKGRGEARGKLLTETPDIDGLKRSPSCSFSRADS